MSLKTAWDKLEYRPEIVKGTHAAWKWREKNESLTVIQKGFGFDVMRQSFSAAPRESYWRFETREEVESWLSEFFIMRQLGIDHPLRSDNFFTPLG